MRSRRATRSRTRSKATSADAPAIRTSSMPSRRRPGRRVPRPRRSGRPPGAPRRWRMSDRQPYVGQRMRRVEDPRLVKGIGTYVDDLRLPGLLHAVILRSPYAHARIAKIDTAAARALPGVVAVLTGADVNASC